MKPPVDLREADERLAPWAFVLLGLVMIWITAAITLIFFIRG